MGTISSKVLVVTKQISPFSFRNSSVDNTGEFLATPMLVFIVFVASGVVKFPIIVFYAPIFQWVLYPAFC